MLTKRFGSLILCAVTVFSFMSVPVKANAQGDKTDEILETAREIISWQKAEAGIEGDSLFSGDFLNGAGMDASDWYVIGASRLGLQEDYSAYFSALEENTAEKYKKAEKLDKNKTTEWDRLILTVLSCGGDPTDFAGADLLADGIFDRKEENSIGKQGLNGWTWALIALDSLYYQTPEGCMFDRKRIINEIMKCQQSDGGFSLNGGKSDIDMTAMALQSLAPYYNEISVKHACDKALNFLSEILLNKGDFGSSESVSQVLIALCSIQADNKNAPNMQEVFDLLMSYKNSDGGFAHKKGGKSEKISSCQALCALGAFARRENGLKRVYDFSSEFSQQQNEQISETAKLFFDGNKKAEENFNDLNVISKTYVCVPTDYSWSADVDICSEMGINNSGNGCIFSIEKMTDFVYGAEFTSADMKTFKKLQNGVSSSDKGVISALIKKAESDKNFQDRENILSELNKMKKDCDNISAEISEINSLIMENLYPFDSVKNEQKELIEQLYGRVQKLCESDKNKITGDDDLAKAYSKFNSQGRNTTAVILTILIIFVGAVMLIFSWRKRRKKRRQEILSEEDQP